MDELSAQGLGSRRPLGRVAGLVYGLLSVASFFVCVALGAAFLLNRWPLRGINAPSRLGLMGSITVDISLAAVFGLQHSLMARERFSRWMGRHVPPALVRSTYVLAASLTLITVFACWEPLPGNLWHVRQPWLRTVLLGLCCASWGLVLVSASAIDAMDLFGLRQLVCWWRRRSYTPPAFTVRGLYRIVRHPIYLATIMALWITPSMSVSRAAFNALATAYVLVGMHFEERDLRRRFPKYQAYCRCVPRLVPRLWRCRRGNRETTLTALPGEH